MPTNNFPRVGYITQGRDFNFFQIYSVSETSFGGASVDGYQPALVITFPTAGLIFTNETSGQVVEYSFNGQTVHGQLDGTSTSTTRIMTFLNRPVCCIWFRLKSGSAGPASITTTAWGIR
jgi:hypothetical protein